MNRQKPKQAMAVVRSGLDSPMPCTMRTAAVARRWCRLTIKALHGASTSSMCGYACLYRQVPERESGPLGLNQLRGRHRPRLVLLEGDFGCILQTRRLMALRASKSPATWDGELNS